MACPVNESNNYQLPTMDVRPVPDPVIPSNLPADTIQAAMANNAVHAVFATLLAQRMASKPQNNKATGSRILKSTRLDCCVFDETPLFIAPGGPGEADAARSPGRSAAKCKKKLGHPWHAPGRFSGISCMEGQAGPGQTRNTLSGSTLLLHTRRIFDESRRCSIHMLNQRFALGRLRRAGSATPTWNRWRAMPCPRGSRGSSTRPSHAKPLESV